MYRKFYAGIAGTERGFETIFLTCELEKFHLKGEEGPFKLHNAAAAMKFWGKNNFTCVHFRYAHVARSDCVKVLQWTDFFAEFISLMEHFYGIHLLIPSIFCIWNLVLFRSFVLTEDASKIANCQTPSSANRDHKKKSVFQVWLNSE